VGEMLRSADKLFNSKPETSKLSFGCEVLDSVFGGGLPVHGIHEICGEAGCGKTQLALQLALRSCLPEENGGLGGRVVYLSSGEGTFPVKRLQQLAQSTVAAVTHTARANSGDNVNSTRSGKVSPLTVDSLMQKMLIRECPSVEALMEVIDNGLAQLMNEGNIRAVVVDSVAGAFRSDDHFEPVKQQRGGCGGSGKGGGRGITTSRSRDLFLFASHLRRLSFLHHAPFIVVNQATASGFNESSFGAENHDVHADAYAISPDLSRIKPALGLSWTTCVNTRIMLTRATVQGGGASSSAWRREAVLMLSPCAPCQKVAIVINTAGVSGLQ